MKPPPPPQKKNNNNNLVYPVANSLFLKKKKNGLSEVGRSVSTLETNFTDFKRILPLNLCYGFEPVGKSSALIFYAVVSVASWSHSVPHVWFQKLYKRVVGADKNHYSA